LAQIIYEEKAPYSRPLKVVVVLLLIWLVIVALQEDTPESLVFAIVLVGGALWSFFNMRFRITTEGVEAVMFPFTGRAKFSEITDVRLGRTPWYSGWGIRYWGRRLAFVSRRGPAVFIKKRKGVFHTLVLTPRDPEGFAEMVRGQISRI